MSKILVVEDDQISGDLFTTILQNLGYDANAANSGAAAIDYLRENQPDLAILDVMMPDMNGIDLLRLIRANPKTMDLPVVMYTALDDENWQARAMDAGADDYWIKGGFGCGELEEKLRSRLAV